MSITETPDWLMEESTGSPKVSRCKIKRRNKLCGWGCDC